jgi:TPR repeat protein
VRSGRCNPEAQYNLGVLDMSGKAWEPDYVSAYMWFSLAAEGVRKNV